MVGAANGGMKVAGYRIIGCIHEGQHSLVFRALRTADGVPVILKRLKAELPTTAQLARMEHEFAVARQLGLPCIVEVFAQLRLENTRALVFEDFGGEALNRSLAGHERPVESCLRLGAQLAGILASVHAAGVIHRDFGPANIIWNPSTGQLKLTDFSLALLLPAASAAVPLPAQIDGTLAYLSPEQTGRMNCAVDSRADLYALGATLYALFTGHPPFVCGEPLELVHAHMTRVPATLGSLRPDVPAVVSDLVAKLLEKEPEARYATASGVQLDLEKCLRELQPNGAIEAFPLAEGDVSGRFMIPQRLYGRTQEVRRLQDAFERVSLDGAELLLVRGYSGTGKSSLVYELHKPVTAKRGYFATGKFNQYQQNIPYSAFRQALTDFCRFTLAEGDAQRQEWRRAILDAVGAHGQLLLDVIPALEWLIGKQPPVEAITPREAQARFNRLVLRFLGVLGRREHPLVLFIDDWQWADSASIYLLKQIFADKEFRHLLVVCAYRDNEVDATHPFMMALDDLQRQAVPIRTLAVENLTPGDLAALIGDTLHESIAEVRELADLVHRKTQGNPFFARSFLRMLSEEALLTFDPGERRWRWDVARIGQQELTGNVVELLARKIRRLPQETQAMLTLAAAVGSRFDLQTLSIISQQPPATCLRLLEPAVNDALVLVHGGSSSAAGAQEQAGSTIFAFQHDRVQQAADAAMAPEEKPGVHHRIGRLLLAELDASQLDERLFEVVDHLNAGRSLVTVWEAQVELMTLNLTAARKAKSATAYPAARQYLLSAFHFVEDEARTARVWSEQEDLALALYEERSESEYLNGDFACAERLVQQAVLRARTALAKAEVLHILIVQYTLLARYPEAIAAGRQALATLGITLPEGEYDRARDEELRAVREAIGGKTVASLFDLPVMSHPEKKMAARLLIAMGPPCYRSHQRLWAVIVPKVVNLCLVHGNIPQVGYSHTAFGGLLGYVSNDYATAIQFGDLASRLMSETFQSATDQSVFHLMIGSSLRHWSKHLRHATRDYEQAYLSGLRSSNLQYAAYAFGHNMYCRFYQGTPLPELLAETHRSLTFSQTRRNEWASDLLEGGQMIFGTLAGTEPVAFNKGPLTEQAFLGRCDIHGNNQVTCIYRILKTLALYVQGDFQAALASSDEADKIVFTVGTQGLLPAAEHVFIRSLILAALHASEAPEQQVRMRAELQVHLQQLRIWSDHAPDNFHHKWLLVSAELARIDDRPFEAMELFDLSIAAAREQGFVHNQAIANECAARFWLGRNKGHLAQVYLRQAHYAYGLWGAAPKVRRLEEEHRDWLRPWSAEEQGSAGGSQSFRELDIDTLVSSAESLSETVKLEPLLEKLMRLALAHAGADTGMLLLPDGASWLIQAQGDLHGITVLQAVPATSSRVPLSLVLYTARTMVPLVVSHAAGQPAHAHDPYLSAHQPKSACSLPLLSRGTLIGILYLENNLSGGVFAPAQVELLRLLSSQMASAIVNARIYDNLERAVEQRTAELRASETRFKTIFQEAPLGIALIDSFTGTIEAVNPMFAGIAGRTVKQMEDIDWMQLTHPDDIAREAEQMALLNAGTISGFQMEKRYLDPAGQPVWISMTIAPLRSEGAGNPHHLCMIEDIADRKQHESEREGLIAELQKALAEVKTLRGFIPICASCKKIRDDSGYWNQIEVYISKHSNAQFSHGICPGCELRLYPE